MKKWNQLSLLDKVSYLRFGIKNGLYKPSIVADLYNKLADGGPENKIPTKVDDQGNPIINKYTGKPVLDYSKVSWYEPWMLGRESFYYMHPEYIDRDRERYNNAKLLRENISNKIKLQQLDRSKKVESEVNKFKSHIDSISKSLYNYIKNLQLGYKQASLLLEEKPKDAIYPYLLMGKSIATAAEFISSAYMLGKGAKALNLLPNNRIINSIYQWDRGQTAISSLGTAADAYLLMIANNTRDKIENSLELPADVAGIIGGTNWFRNTPFFGRYGNQIDNTLDFMGYTAAGYDVIFKPLNWMWNNFNKEEEK